MFIVHALLGKTMLVLQVSSVPSEAWWEKWKTDNDSSKDVLAV